MDLLAGGLFVVSRGVGCARGYAAATADAGTIGAIPSGNHAFELKWDGFRAIVGRNGGFSVRSRRGWDMTKLLPQLGDLPVSGIFDGELVAFSKGRPHFPLVCDRLLRGDRTVPLTFVIFDVVDLDGEQTMQLLYSHRRALLEEVELGAGPWFVPRAIRGWHCALRGCLRAGARGRDRQAAIGAVPAWRALPGSRSRTVPTGATKRRSSHSERPSNVGSIDSRRTRSSSSSDATKA